MHISEIILKEQSSGYLDAAVFGGFAAYLAAEAERCERPTLLKLANAYQAATPRQRPALLAEICQLLTDQPLPPRPKAQAMAAAELPATFSLPLSSLKNIGGKRAELFVKLGLHTLGELIEFFPRDYQDRRSITPIAAAAIGAQVNLSGTIIKTELTRSRNGLAILKCVLEDDTGIMPLIWFNQPFLQKKFYQGRQLTVFGKVERRAGNLSLVVQDYQTEEEKEDWQGILPVYALTSGLSQKVVRYVVQAAWQRCEAVVDELLPAELREKRLLLPRKEALYHLHFPTDFAMIQLARRSLAYEELLLLQLTLQKNAAPPLTVSRQKTDDAALTSTFQQLLPYPLTTAQKRVIAEIYHDLNQPTPMARLVQGDVGSGKTVVAAAAIHKVCSSGKQAALMVPTEILAQQHFQSLAPLLAQLGLRTVLLTGSSTAAERRQTLAELADGSAHCAIGTHALIQDQVAFAALGLAITDEQHRFGVAQRARLRGEGNTDLLIMTATPIPRTLAMTIYADLQLSLIDELPPGRQPIKTNAVGYGYEQRIYRFIDKEIARGRQAFIVCPLVEESEKLELASATQVYETLSRKVFPHRRVALLHGKLKAAEKDAVMAEFRAGNYDILVATTVIEVGVNIPNATVMLIRDAERFGLAQLHQLRGRIGRGDAQSYCILLHNAESEVAKARMRIIAETTDGFRLAEADLEQRGPGEFFGHRQHGLPELKIANIFTDADLLAQAQQDAKQILDGHLPFSPTMEQRVHQLSRLFT